MTISPYVTLSTGSVAASRSGSLFVGLRRELDELQRQLATGKTAETYGGLGLQRGASLDIRGKLAAINGYFKTIKDAQFRVTLMTQGLQSLTKAVGDTASELLPPRFDPGPDGRTSAQPNAEQRLKLAIDVLNTDVNGRYVFAGRSSDKPPVIGYDTIMNGDGVRMGLKDMIPERIVADQAGDGLGHATLGTLSAGGIESLTVSTTDAARLGIKIVGLSEIMANAALPGTATSAGVTTVAGVTTAQIDFTGAPNAGERFQLLVQLPDGTQRVLDFTAVAPPATGAPGTFAIDPSAAVTRDNALNAIQASLAGLMASDDAKTSSSIAAAEEFFAASINNPIPVGAYSRPVVTWYVGDDDTAAVPDARNTAPARIDSNAVVGVGARANEEPIRNVLAQWGVLAAESFANTPADRQRYHILADKVRTNLEPSDQSQKIDSVVSELGSALVWMNGAEERHGATEAVLQDTLAGIETAKPEEVAAAILALQTRLQASYQTTSLLAHLSIVNYL